MIILFCLVHGVAASSKNTDSGLCHQYFTDFQPNIGGVIEYQVLLDQAIEARRIRTGSREELLNLTDRDPTDPYAHLEGSLTLLPKCSRNETHGGKTVFEAYLRNVKIACLDQNAGAAHFDDCRSTFGPLEAAFKSFWFTQSSDTMLVSEFRTLPDETAEVRAFEYGIAQLFGMTPGNCSSISVDSKEMVKVVHQDDGFHGTDPNRQMKFHSLRVHDFAVQTDDAAVGRKGIFLSSTSRAMYALDVHGNTRSGRVRDHHFVHTSLKLKLKDSYDDQQAALTSTMTPGLSDCTSDHFMNRRIKNVENETVLEFIETQMFSSRVGKSNQQEVAEDQVVLQGIDITKAVTFCLDILERARDAIRDGLNAIYQGIQAIDDFRRRLFSEQEGKIYEGLELIKSIAKTVDQIDEKVQSFAKAVADPKSAEKLVHDIKMTAAIQMKQMTKEVQAGINFFAGSVVKVLDKLNEYPEVLFANLKPLTDLIANILQVLGPTISKVQGVGQALTDHASDAPSAPKAEFTLAMLPKSFAKQITDSKPYQLIFGQDGKGGAIGKMNELAKNDGEGIPAATAKFIISVVREVGEVIKDSVNENVTNFEIQLRKEFNSVLEKPVANGAPKLSKNIAKLAGVVKIVKMGLATTIKKTEEMRTKADNTARANLKKFRKLHDQAKEYAQTIQSHLEMLIKLLAEGKSFSSEKKYRIGLMKGWSVVGKAQATVSVGAVPTPNVQTKASLGVCYQATSPDRAGSIIEITMAPSAKLESSVNSLGQTQTNVVFSPKLQDLIPMMSILGGEPMPLSTDPVKMFEQVLPQVQMRIMNAIADTGFWYPILIDFIRDKVLSVPAVQKVLGGLNMGDATALIIPGAANLKDQALAVIQANYAETCKQASDAISDAAGDAIAQGKAGLMKAFKAPFAMFDEILSSLDLVWPILKKLLEVVHKHASELPAIKEAMCPVQEKFFGGLTKVCARIDSVVALVGGKLETLIALLDHAGGIVDCKDASKAINDRLEKIVKKLQKNSKGLFAVCAYEPVLTDCSGGQKVEEKSNSRTFIDHVFGFGQLLIDIAESTQGKKGEAAVKAFVAKTFKAGAQIVELGENKEGVYSEVMAALAPLAKLANENPLASFAKAKNECWPLISKSATIVKNLISDLDKEFRRLRDLVSRSAANPDTMITQLAEIFNDVGVLARTHASTIFDKQASDECEKALKKLSAGGATAIAILSAAKEIAPQLQKPMYQVADVAEYVANALECSARLVPPIKRATAVILDLIHSDRFTPDVVENAITKLESFFAAPLQCVKKDIIVPLEPLFAPYMKAVSQADVEAQAQIERAKDFANAVNRGIRSVQKLIEAGMNMYPTLKKMIGEVQKFRKAISASGVAPGLNTALSVTRTFKNAITNFIGPLRDLREVLQLFALDEETLLNLLDGADHTLVGLEAGCDVVIDLVLHPPPKPPKGASFLEIGEVGRLNRRNKRGRSTSQQSLQAEFLRKEHTTSGPSASGAQALSEELLAKLANMEKQLQTQNSKLDQLQESSDVMSAKMHATKGGGDSGVEGSMSAAEKEDARSNSKALLKAIETEQKKLKCPGTHTAVGDGAMKKLLLEKDIDLLAESITVPPESTYGVIVKISIFVHAVANIYLDAVVCDCLCTTHMEAPCSELLIIGPSMNLHILGVGSASLSVKILSIKAIAAIQLGSLMAQTQLHIGRVAHEVEKLCVKDLPSAEASFGGALTANVDAQMLKGQFHAEVVVLGFPKKTPPIQWDGLRWNLGSFCFEPSKSAKKLRQLNPPVCPSKASLGFKPMAVTLKTANRGVPSQAAQRSCSVCHIEKVVPSPGDKIGLTETPKTRWACEYPSVRTLSLAGFATVPDVSGLGQHFLLFLKDKRLDLESLIVNPDYGYFSNQTSNTLKDALKTWKSGQEAPRLKRLFWDGASSSGLRGKDVPQEMKFRGGIWPWGAIKKTASAAVTAVAKTATEAAKSAHRGVFGHQMTGLGQDNRLVYLSAIFLCSEKADVVGSNLQYNGTVFMRFSLTKELHRHPDMKARHSATDKAASPFKTRYNLEREATEDASARFAVGFSFAMTIPVSAGEATPNEVIRNYKQGKGLDSPKTWESEGPATWRGTKKGGVKIWFQLLKAPMLSEIESLRQRWKSKTCTRASTKDASTKDASTKDTSKKNNKDTSTKDTSKKNNKDASTKDTQKIAALSFLEEAESVVRSQTRHGQRQKHEQAVLSARETLSKASSDKKTTRQFDIYETAATIFTPPDFTSERISVTYPFDQQFEESDASYLYALPSSKNTFQVTYNAAGTPGVGDVSSSCNRPWHFKQTLQDLFSEGREGSQMQEEMCERTKAMIMQEPRETGGTNPRHPVETYTHARTKAIQQLDAQPCADSDVSSWPTGRDDRSPEQLALNTQQCFTCNKIETTMKTEKGHEKSTYIWKCPVVGRRQGMVIAAKAQWLKSTAMFPELQKPNKKYGEGQYVRNLLYTMGQRVAKALQDKYSVQPDEVTRIILCGERVARSVKSDGGNERAFHYSGLVFVTIDSPRKHKVLVEAADEDDLTLHVLMLNQEFTEQDMVKSRVAWPNAADDGPNAFLSTIIDKCDPDKKRDAVAVDAQSVAQEILCSAHDAYMSVYYGVKVAFDKMRSERKPCRINPKIKNRVYTSKYSSYTFFGWRLGQMAAEATNVVRTNKMCHICAFAPPIKVEGESQWQSFKKRAKKFLSTHEGNLQCNIDHTGKALEDHKPRLAALNLFDEEVAEGTSAWRTLDYTVQQAIARMAKNSSFWAQVEIDQVNGTWSDINWRDRKSTVAVCDEIGMENIPVSQVGASKATKLMKTLNADAQLYGNTICARRGWQMECFQVLIPIDDIMPMSKEEAYNNSGYTPNDWDGINMQIWRGEGEKENEIGGRDTGHAFFFQVFTEAAIDAQKHMTDEECPSVDDLQIPEASTQGQCDSDGIGATEGYKCRVIREGFNTRKLKNRVDARRTCDDTMPTWESLEYSQRFVTKSCIDMVVSDGEA